MAVDFLRGKGLRILARNYRFKKKEIDIIAEDKGTICFVEVKTRTSKGFGYPEEAVTEEKKKNLVTLAINYIKKFGLTGHNVRFDVISILWERKKPVLNYIKNAFIAEDFWTI
ncbi:MAG: YraN family protein [Candidatus Omnitrophica bacterium]|nr:YraN family protein [Candidatus Omnitrophota bacterium]MCM8798098.1 YraN family protein [Candidatus Omnitrophota bacterium]